MDEERNTQTDKNFPEENGSQENDKHMNKSVVIYIVSALIIVTLIALFTLRPKSPSQDEISTQSSEEEIPQTKTSLSISDTTADNTITIDTVDIVSYGFISVHEDNDGTPGDAIGVSPFFTTGTYDDVLIPLDRDVEEGEILYVQIVADDGNQIYDYPKGDQLVLNESESPVWATITITFSDEADEVVEAEETEEAATESAEEEEEVTPTEIITE